VTSDLYENKYKGIGLSLAMLSRALNGSYVNFGVFELYNDPALSNALDAAMKMALSIPPDEVCQVYTSQNALPWHMKALFGMHVQ
jgi:exportin-7